MENGDHKNDPMKRLVYKHDVIVALNEKIDEPIDFVEALKNLPVVDAVEVVRCKDCKKRNTRACIMNNNVGMNKDLFDDDYCSYGK